jgi:secretion/DNA translocation related TadE-like protein
MIPARRGGVAVHRGRDRGSITVVVLGVGLVTILLGLATAGVAAAVLARHRARAAADAAALAGAAQAMAGVSSACAAADSIAVANGATLTDCALDGWDVVVTVDVVPGPIIGLAGVASAAARAGPA